MAKVKAGKLELDPARNPAVLDTTTWDPAAAWSQVKAAGTAFWEQVARGLGAPALPKGECQVHPGSFASLSGRDIALATLKDGQDVFVQIGRSAEARLLGKPLGSLALADGNRLTAHATDMPMLERYLREANPEKAPRAMGSVPRLGIGDRHTVAVWPAAFRAMEKAGFAANAIQNSLRELNLLDDLKQGKPAQENYLFGFGRIAEGHTGSTFEGLLHAGVMAALKAPTYPRYGADADHIQVKRGPDGLARAKRVVEAARHYTFFTLDVSDILAYGAMHVAHDSDARALLSATLNDPAREKDVRSYHGRPRTIAGRHYAFSEADVGRMVGKYWNALAAVEALYAHLKALKLDDPFDVELSIDENPPELATEQCITSLEEMVFLAIEIQRRHLPVTHIAPNFGVEKGTDYRCADGLEGLEKRVRSLSRIAAEYNLMLDCHSGDDLKKATRRVFGRASGGRINFKISPQLQILFAETLYDVQRDLFQHWWSDVHAFVRAEAAAGSSFAAQCLKELETNPDPRPGAGLFHYYCFVSVGRRDSRGLFVNRERLYDLSPQFLAEYGSRLENWLREIAEDLYGQS
jgi:hypothetical protein